MELTAEKKKQFKKTEMGWIPEDWQVKRLSDIIDLKNGYAFKSKLYLPSGKYNIVTISNVQNGYMDASTFKKINVLPDDIQPHQILNIGELLISMTGNVGRICEVVVKNALLNQRVGLLIPKQIDKAFLYHSLGRDLFIQSMIDKAKGGAQGNIGKSDILDHAIPMPIDRNEQQAIAEALSDVDDLIRSLDTIIEKKSAIKKGAMQQLLTGKRRLDGFSREWEEISIENFASIRGRVGWRGYTKEDIRESGPLAIGAKHISKSHKLDLSEPTHLVREKYLESPEIMVQKNDVLLVQRGTIGKVVLIEEDIGEATINPSMVILRLYQQLPIYVYYQLISENGQQQILEDTSSTGVPMISQKTIGQFKILFPPSIEEQQAIARILSNMDDELQSLRQKREKYKQIKQGMMQELLTGKTRLV